MKVDSNVNLGLQGLVDEILEFVKAINPKIQATHIPYGELLVRRYTGERSFRQVAPGSSELTDVMTIKDKSIAFNLDLSGGDSSNITYRIQSRVIWLLRTVEYKRAEFFIYGDPMYQGEGIFGVQWGIMVEV